jgi:4-amino-4-deoxy-L-arabinose transferase-like glycosyltransferase
VSRSKRRAQPAKPVRATKPEEPSQPEPSSEPGRKALVAVFLVTVALRWVYFATANGPSFADPLIDGDYYDYLGSRLASGEGFDPGPFWQPPLYAVVLGLLYSVLGHDLVWPRLMQSMLDGVTAVLAVQIAARVVGERRWAMGAGVIVALHGTLVFYSGEILPTSLAVTASTLAVWLAVARPPSLRHAIGCGVAAGLGALAVATTLVVVGPLVWFVGRENRQRGWAVLGACLALVAVATVANRARSGEWVLISANGGINLYIGNAERSDELMAVRPGARWERMVNEPADAGISSPSGQDGYFVRKAVRWCAEDPVDCVAGLAWKARLLLRSQEIARNESVEVVREQSPVLSVLLARFGTTALPHVLLLPLAAAGLVAAFRRRERSARLVAWATISLASMPVIFFVTGRYRTALAAMLAVLVVLGAHALWTLRKKAWREALAAASVLAFAVWPAPLPVDNVNYEAEMHYAIGGRRARLGDEAGATANWQQAVSLRPDYLEAHFNLGLAHVRAERWHEAENSFRAALAIDPANHAVREMLDACESQTR